ncbi:MAG: type II toxin-antitoxin system RelE/ParE family toxin [Candidatus Marinimicrobia bacterium]|nr:type II toxin-antitoxin system RelE/ParE family toxin [bacterium]MCG2716013.1 type II toxin-antitoxin system RelE/ParE family toxin [Candidatus Neomarinimicrobiota bacterium]
MKIIWTREALNNILEIENYIFQDNLSKAIEFTDFLIDKCEYLINNPEIGRVVPELSDPQIRELIVKNYRIVYRHIDEEIQILTVFEGHLRLPLDY